MSSIIFLADDKSPLIHYGSGWLAGNSYDDNSADQYFRGTFQTSNVTGGVVEFSFNGTAFWIYGAKRSNHGTFTVTVDNQSYSNINGESSTNLFQQVLFNQSGLAQGMHTVSLTNTGSGTTNYVDIDLVTWQSDINTEQLVMQTIDDADSAFQYQEPAWSANPTNVNLFSNATGHSTSTYNASATLTFTAESVSIFGSVGPGSGQYSVSLDFGPATTYNATAYLTFYQVMLYHADNLGPGQHQLTLTNLPDSNAQTLDIDYAELLTSSSESLSTNSSGSPGPSETSSVNAVSAGLGSSAIAGIVVVAVVALLASTAAFVFYRRWKSALAASQDVYHIHTPRLPPLGGVTGASSSVETRSNTSLVRNELSPSTTSWRSYQQPDYNRSAQRDGRGRHNQGSGDSRIPTVDEVRSSPIQSPVEEFGNARRPLPDAPGTERNIFQQPVPEESLGISKASAAQHRVSMQINPATTSDLPPDYMQATR